MKFIIHYKSVKKHPSIPRYTMWSLQILYIFTLRTKNRCDFREKGIAYWIRKCTKFANYTGFGLGDVWVSSIILLKYSSLKISFSNIRMKSFRRFSMNLPKNTTSIWTLCPSRLPTPKETSRRWKAWIRQAQWTWVLPILLVSTLQRLIHSFIFVKNKIYSNINR